MFARVSTIKGKPQTVEEGIRDYQSNMLPEARKMPGFKGAYLLADRKNGKMVGITLWDSEKAVQESAAAADKLRAAGNKAAGAAEAPAVEVYEVAVKP